MKCKYRVLFGTACVVAAMLVVALAAASRVNASPGVLSDAEMAVVYGSAVTCNCDATQNVTDECNANGCPSCKNSSDCGTYADVGTGNSRHVCKTIGTPNGVCEVDGPNVLCTERYDCNNNGDAENNVKCSSSNTCSDTSPGGQCRLCNKGTKWSDGNNTYKVNYKCTIPAQ